MCILTLWASIEQLMLQFLFESASLIVISDYARLA